MKYLVFVGLSLLLVACATKDEAYYLNNPAELQVVMKNCPASHPDNLTCDQLVQLAIKLNSMGAELGRNPQGFGRSILSLQETIAKQKAARSTTTDSAALEKSIAENEKQLVQRLAIVKWLESPES